MKLSIIMATYNVQHVIEQSLRALLDYQDPNIEIIVVDNGSTDSTATVVEPLAIQHKNIKLIRCEKQCGVGFAYNLGMEEARGNYLWFVGGNSVISKGSMCEILNMISKNPHELLFIPIEMYSEEKITHNRSFGENPFDILSVVAGMQKTYLIENHKNGFDYIVATILRTLTQGADGIGSSFTDKFREQILQFLSTFDLALVQSYFSSTHIRSCKKDAPFELLWNLGYFVDKHIFKDELIVSLIVTSYNTAKWLDQTFEFLQNLPKDTSFLEVLIVDDASTDDSVAYFKILEQKYSFVKLHVFEENTIGGVGIPANYGIRQAKGKIIAFLDSDDMLHWNEFVKEITRMYLFDIDILVFDYENYLEKQNLRKASKQGSLLNTLRETRSSQEVRAILVREIVPTPWSKFYKRSFLVEKGISFPEADHFYEDVPFHWFAVTQAENIHVSNSIIYIYRQERDGQTMSFRNALQVVPALLCHAKQIKCFLISHKLFDLYQDILDEYVSNRINQYQVSLLEHLHVAFQYAQMIVDLPKSSKSLQELLMMHSKTVQNEKEMLCKQLQTVQNEKDMLCKQLQTVQNEKDMLCKQLQTVQNKKEMLCKQLQITQHNKWYRFGAYSRKRKVWVIGKVLAKKLHIYWLLKPFARFVRISFHAFRRTD